MKTPLFLIFSFILCAGAIAQVIPASNRVNWTYAGYPGKIPQPNRILTVTGLGASGDGITDNYAFIKRAIDSLKGKAGVIYFPKGNYLIRSPLVLPDSIILRGASPEVTTLSFHLGETAYDCISISGEASEPFTAIISGYLKDATDITVANTASFKPGDFAEIRQKNGSWDTKPASWAEYSIGQIVQIKNVNNNTIMLSHPLRIDYQTMLNPEIRKIKPLTQVGIECLKIERLDAPPSGGGYNISFRFAAMCWVKGVESHKSIGSHIALDASSQVTVSGCYFHEAFEYTGSSTRGYGVTLFQHAGECLIANNIFRRLRHAMMVKQGANGNVFAYNYSIEPYRTEVPSDFPGDISLHGHYPFANLFEGNIVQNIYIDLTWGPNGPFNTFFRNRAELYGIIMSSGNPNSDHQNMVGNEVSSTAFLKGNYTLNGDNHLAYGNNIKGNILPAGTISLNDRSYYLNTIPDFWQNIGDWPSIGIPKIIGTGTIPAKLRYATGKNLTVCEITEPIGIDDPFSSAEPIAVFPNPFSHQINIRLNSHQKTVFHVSIHDLLGKTIMDNIFEIIPGSNNILIELPQHLNKGLFYLQLHDPGKGVYFHKVIKQ